jgi:hypothetical protein
MMCENGKIIYWERKRSTPCIFNQKILQYSYVTRTSLLAIRTSLLAIRTSLLAIRTSLLAIRTSLLAIRTSLLAIRGLHINPTTPPPILESHQIDSKNNGIISLLWNCHSK